MPEKTLYRIEVAPVIILPLEKSPLFSYASPKEIPLGSLVKIPFGSREIEGIVYNQNILPGKQPVWMKQITRVEREAFLTENQRELALFISEEYFTPLGRVLKHFLPKRVQMREKTAPETAHKPAPKGTKEELLLVKKFQLTKEDAIVSLDSFALSDANRFLFLLAKRNSRTQTLILVPEIPLLSGLADTASLFFDTKNIAVLHSKLSPGVSFDTWERIRSGEATVILATRLGLFAPFKKLGLVVLTEEQDDAYKQWDMSPRYNGKKVAEALSRISRTRFLLTSATQSTETYLGIQEKEIIPLIPPKEKPPLGTKLTLINLKLERYRKNYSPLSEQLVESIRNTLSQKKQILLYIHRQGLSAFSICESCKDIFRCPESGHALVDTPDGYYKCLGCAYKTPLFPSCPKCHGLSFRHIGFGTERIEKEVKKIFFNAKIVRADRSTMNKAGEIEKLYQNGMKGKIDILIGTQMVIKDPPLPNLGLVAMIDADSLLSWPDFRADERLFQHLYRFVGLLEKRAKGEVLIQTFHPESTFFERVITQPSKEVYEKILMERESLFYPPYSRLLSLTCQDKDEKSLQKSLDSFATALEEIQKKEAKLRFHILETPRYLKREKVFESSILIRIPNNTPFSTALQGFLKIANKTSIIDIDPLSFH